MANSPWTPIVFGLFAVAYAASGLAGPTFQRFASVAGAMSVGSLILLGAIWPSAYTLLALFSLPALYLLVWQVVSPKRFRSSLAYVYLVGVLWLSVGASVRQYEWLNGGCVAAGKCVPSNTRVQTDRAKPGR